MLQIHKKIQRYARPLGGLDLRSDAERKVWLTSGEWNEKVHFYFVFFKQNITE